jgi:hypothetical protein
MLDGLRRDYPQVFALARRVPNPRVPRAPLGRSILFAFGASLFVGIAIGMFFMLFARLFGLPTQWVGGLATLGATATALAVAWTSRGRDAVIVYAAIFVAELVLTLPGQLRYCLAIVSATPTCSTFSYVLGFWPQALGAAAAYWLARWFRAAEGTEAPILEAAGALALAQSFLGAILAGLLLSTSTLESGVAILLAAVAGGAACGLVIVRRVPEPSRQWTILAFIAVALVGSWMVIGIPQFMGQVGIAGGIAIGGLNLLAFASPLVEVGAASVVLYMAAARKVRVTERA